MSVEWVEVTAKTVQEAKDMALDQLGVDEQDAEFDVLEEPKAGLFGRLRSEARVRARVLPTAPRPKVERRGRREGRRERSPGGGRGGGRPVADRTAAGRAAPDRTGRDRGGGDRGAGDRGAGDRGTTRQEGRTREVVAVDHESTDGAFDAISAAEEAEVAAAFVRGVLDAFAVGATVTTETPDEDTVRVRVNGGDLGLLIGPRGQTLTALEELTRTVVQRRGGGRHSRVRVDVGEYRERRQQALEQFTRRVAEEVRTSGVAKVLEAMPPPDRKVVHDVVNEIEGVTTMSEGEEPRRRVVIVPERRDA